MTWEIVEGGAALTGDFSTGPRGTSRTDARGIARAGLRGELLVQQTSAVLTRVRASCDAGSVELHAFSTYWPPGLPSMPAAYVLSPESRNFGTHPPGTILPGAVVAQVAFSAGTEQGQAFAGVGVRFVTERNPSGDEAAPLSCANATDGAHSGGTIFTDATGFARCDVRLPDAPGTYGVGVRVGGAIDFAPFRATVRVAPR